MQKGSPNKYGTTNPVANRLVGNFFDAVSGVFPRDAETALEVGCGEGEALRRLRDSFPRVVFSASDIDPELVRAASERNPGVSVTTESIYRIHRPGRSFDVVLALEVMEHLERPADALREIARVSRRYCVISVPHEPWWSMANMARGAYWKSLGNTPGHLNRWSKRLFTRFVSTELRPMTVRTSFPWTIVLAEKKRA